METLAPGGRGHTQRERREKRERERVGGREVGSGLMMDSGEKRCGPISPCWSVPYIAAVDLLGTARPNQRGGGHARGLP